jgi:hypothetical protein
MSTIQNKSKPPKPRASRAIVTVLTVAALAVPASAFAQAGSPTDAEYDSTLTQITAGGSEEPPAPPTPLATPSGDAEGTLPFTGLDLAAMALVAGGLGVAGFAMRRRVLGSDDTP